MSDNTLITELNTLRINLEKSLLQYAGESCLWTAIEAEEEREVYHSLVARQKSNSEALVNIFIERRWDVDQGTYPTEYTDLHYVAFEIAKNETQIAESIKSVISFYSDDEEIKSVLERILNDTEDNIQQLNKVSASR